VDPALAADCRNRNLGDQLADYPLNYAINTMSS